jgi:hypothetical protein
MRLTRQSGYRGTRPELISARHRAILRTTPSSVAAIAVHYCFRTPTTGRSERSMAYSSHSRRSGCSLGRPTYQPGGVAASCASRARSLS